MTSENFKVFGYGLMGIGVLVIIAASIMLYGAYDHNAEINAARNTMTGLGLGGLANTVVGTKSYVPSLILLAVGAACEIAGLKFLKKSN